MERAKGETYSFTLEFHDVDDGMIHTGDGHLQPEPPFFPPTESDFMLDAHAHIPGVSWKIPVVPFVLIKDIR